MNEKFSFWWPCFWLALIWFAIGTSKSKIEVIDKRDCSAAPIERLDKSTYRVIGW